MNYFEKKRKHKYPIPEYCSFLFGFAPPHRCQKTSKKTSTQINPKTNSKENCDALNKKADLN